MQGPIETRNFPKASPNFYSLAGLTHWKGLAKSEEKQLLKLLGFTTAASELARHGSALGVNESSVLILLG